MLLDAQDKPLLPAMLYTDPRGLEQSDRLARDMNPMYIAGITGAYPNPMYSLPKLMWVMENRPDIWAKVKHVMLTADYVAFCLSGQRQIDASLAARTMALDIAKCDWSDVMLNAVGIRREIMPPVVASGTPIGNILPKLAEELGLPKSVQIISGCHDQIAACVGAGVLHSGMAADGSGTTQCITPVYDGIPDTERIQHGRYAVIPFVNPNEYASYAFFFTGGAMLKWYRDEVMGRVGDGNFYSEMNARLCDAPTGLLALPHFAGAGTPYMNPTAHGAILGLNVHTTAAEIYRGLMEGVAYEMRMNLEELARADIHIDRLMASGGGARSAEWLQIKADVLNTPMTALQTSLCGTLGCIMLSGRACGAYASLEEGAGVFVRKGKEYLPRPEFVRRYDEIFERYKRVYAAVSGVYA